MPRLNFRLIAGALTVLILTGAVALYMIHRSAVHAKPPPSLAALALDARPVAMPEVAFVDAAGTRRTLAAFKGHYVLLNLWATWCAPCVKELPALARLQAADPGLVVVAVNASHNSNAADTAAFLRAHGAGTLSVYMDSNAALISAFGAAGLPLSVLIDPQGREVARASGPADWDQPGAIAWFKALAAS
ncbi:MAG TPA: TlpA disulfide reductase family protein [Rhizomicrobium sp.]|nr:TlpA disulfide reductase family protein [Rhizomicrobium sp.]